MKIVQEWFAANVPSFIEHRDWSFGSPDLNPLAYKLWKVLEKTCYSRRYHNLESLGKSIVKSAYCMVLKTICAVINDWLRYLHACIVALGVHFE